MILVMVRFEKESEKENKESMGPIGKNDESCFEKDRFGRFPFLIKLLYFQNFQIAERVLDHSNSNAVISSISSSPKCISFQTHSHDKKALRCRSSKRKTFRVPRNSKKKAGKFSFIFFF